MSCLKIEYFHSHSNKSKDAKILILDSGCLLISKDLRDNILSGKYKIFHSNLTITYLDLITINNCISVRTGKYCYVILLESGKIITITNIETYPEENLPQKRQNIRMIYSILNTLTKIFISYIYDVNGCILCISENEIIYFIKEYHNKYTEEPDMSYHANAEDMPEINDFIISDATGILVTTEIICIQHSDTLLFLGNSVFKKYINDIEMSGTLYVENNTIYLKQNISGHIPSIDSNLEPICILPKIIVILNSYYILLNGEIICYCFEHLSLMNKYDVVDVFACGYTLESLYFGQNRTDKMFEYFLNFKHSESKTIHINLIEVDACTLQDTQNVYLILNYEGYIRVSTRYNIENFERLYDIHTVIQHTSFEDSFTKCKLLQYFMSNYI